MSGLERAGQWWQLYKMGGLAPAVASMFNADNARQMALIRSAIRDQRQRSIYSIGLREMEAAAFDLETTGFSPYGGDAILSFGAVLLENGEARSDRTFYCLVNPGREIPEEVAQLTGISYREAALSPGLLEALRSFLEFVQKRVLIVHGSGHDRHFLNAALWRTTGMRLTHRLLDTMMMAKWLLPGLSDYGLDSVLLACGIPAPRRHHALEDSLLTARLWNCLLKELEARSVRTLGDLYEKLSRLS